MNLTDQVYDSSSTQQGDSISQKIDTRFLNNIMKGCQTKLKIELCRNFIENRYCIYGNRCNFAHGYQELCVNNQNAHKLKTNYCKLFHQKMHCKYGLRCNFLHQNQQLQQIVNTSSEKKLHLLQSYPQIVLIRGPKKSRLLKSLQSSF